ncbi:DUF4241 domain-containing protein [Bacillus altitudinis]|uniref:DUF4241 domain-containing protein n=1 Tax=Bacillus altitudinis TaxID=293387 RepID=UPI0022810568|nr:DUF4241 domain-containing protein [Bacillus altitudinis]MCY7694917.1 DUF4241 domain-containing protein [Bacillus altitudinis]
MYNINPTNLLYRNRETTSSQEGDQLFAKQIGNIEITSAHNDFYFYEEFAEALEQNYKLTWDWLVTRFHDKVDIAMFTTGFGDGMYPSFWGLDENGELACLVTDFLIMD